MGSGSDWLPIARQIGNRAYSILPDLPGHGHNINRDFHLPLSFDLLAAELADLIEHLGFESLDLVGYSMGGRLALYFALQYPHKVRNLILESANPGIILEKDREDRRAVDLTRAQEILTAGMASFVDHWYQMPLFQSLEDHRARLDRLIIARKKNHPHWIARVIQELSPGNQPHVWNQLHLLNMPVLLIAGAKDIKYIHITKKLAAALPQASLSIMDKAGHNCHFENSQEFSQVLQSFLSQNVSKR